MQKSQDTRRGCGSPRLFADIRREWQKAEMNANPAIIQTAVSADGKKRWRLLQRSDGFLTYDEDTYFTEDLTEFEAGIMEYWSPTHFSGLFHTEVEARTDALGTLPWLQAALPAE